MVFVESSFQRYSPTKTDVSYGAEGRHTKLVLAGGNRENLLGLLIAFQVALAVVVSDWSESDV